MKLWIVGAPYEMYVVRAADEMDAIACVQESWGDQERDPGLVVSVREIAEAGPREIVDFYIE